MHAYPSVTRLNAVSADVGGELLQQVMWQLCREEWYRQYKRAQGEQQSEGNGEEQQRDTCRAGPWQGGAGAGAGSAS